MKLITRQSLADEAPQRFAKVYAREEIGNRWGKIIVALAALPKPVDPDEVDRIIGNTSWTRVPDCDECGASDLPAVMQVGQEPDYESSTAEICFKCAHKAMAELTVANMV